MTESKITDCIITDLKKIHNRAGNITIVEGLRDVSFSIRRIYYLYDIPGGGSRGGHAHRDLYQLIVAASGSFIVLIDDGRERKEIFLNRPDRGLLIVPGIWRELTDFSSGAICLVLASALYNESDYIRDYTNFLSVK